MKDIVAEVQAWRDTFATDYAAGYRERAPSEANALRQFVFCVVADFIEESLDNTDSIDGVTAFYNALASDDDGAIDHLINEWVTRTYGDD